MTHLPRPATIRGLESSIRPEGTRRSASRSVVSGEHSKAPPTTPLARETSSDKVFQAGRQRLKPSSGTLITRPTCRTDLVYHRDHLEYVVGERAGHRIGTMCPSDQRDSGDDITSPSASGRRTNSEVLRHCLQENGWCADARLVEGGVAPGHGPKSEPTHPART